MSKVESFTIPAEEARTKVFHTEEWPIVEEKVTGTSRWCVYYDAIVRIPTDPEGVHREVSFSRGATEYQDESPWEYDKEVTFYPVVKKKVILEQWVSVVGEEG